MRDTFIRKLWLNLAIIVTAIAGAAIALFFVLADVSSHAEVISRLQSTVATRNNDLAMLANLEASAPAAATYGAVIEKLLPSQDSLLQFPRQIQSLAASFNVVVRASFVGEPSTPTPGTPGVAAFSLNASGKTDDLLLFLKNIETQSSQFLVAIDSIDFSGDAASGHFTASGRVFFQ